MIPQPQVGWPAKISAPHMGWVRLFRWNGVLSFKAKPRLCPTPATARFISGFVGFFSSPSSRQPIPTAPEQNPKSLVRSFSRRMGWENTNMIKHATWVSLNHENLLVPHKGPIPLCHPKNFICKHQQPEENKTTQSQRSFFQKANSYLQTQPHTSPQQS